MTVTKLLRKEPMIIAGRGDVFPRGVSISDGHLALRGTLALPEHLGGGACKAVELSPY